MTFMVKTLLQRCDKGIQVQFLKDRTELSISSMLQPSIRRHCRKIFDRFARNSDIYILRRGEVHFTFFRLGLSIVDGVDRMDSEK